MNDVPAAGRPASPLREEVLRHTPLIRQAMWYSLVINLLVLAPTMFMLEVYERVVNSRNATTLAMLLVLVIGAFVVMALLEVVRGAILHRVALQVDGGVRTRLFNAMFRANLQRMGAATTQPFSDLKVVREFIGSPALTAMMDSPSSLIFLALVFIISPWLGVMAMVGALIQLYIAVRTEKQTMPDLTEANKAAIEAQAYANNTLRNAQVIEAMGMLGHMRKRWAFLQRKFLTLQAKASDHSGMNSATSKLVQTMQGSLLLGAACWLSLKGGLLGGGGMMIVASTLGARVLAPLTQLVAQWRTVVNARDARERLDKALAGIAEEPPTMTLPAPKGRLSAEAVIAGAPGSPMPILRGVSFAVEPGEAVVVIGPSAAGKTTLARLLVGVWPAASGKVRLDGVDVFSWNKDELGPYVGYLPQGVELFDGSIAENIARFGDVDIEQVKATAVRVGLGEFIESLPQGYDTRIGDDGAFLSGGQRQRVGLARAIYGNPRLLVLDEPNSSLDEAGDLALVALLGQLKQSGTTVVLISHRASVLPAADKLLVLREGQVVMFGPRDEVLAAIQKAAAQAGAPARPQMPRAQNAGALPLVVTGDAA